MKALWKGSISFGLVSIPVEVFPATEEKSIGFHQLHDRDLGRIRYHKVCELCGEEVPPDHIVKGYEHEKDHHVAVTDDDLSRLPLPSRHVIDIAYFVEPSQIDCIFFQRTYYLVPAQAGLKPYGLLRKVLQEDSRIAIAKVAFRDKEHLAAIRLLGKGLVLQTMFWPDEIRQAAFPELDEEIEVRPQELAMAKSFVQNLTEEWRPEEFRNDYREVLRSLIEDKIEGREPERAAETEEGGQVIDLVEALRASVQAARTKRGSKEAAGKRAGSAG